MLAHMLSPAAQRHRRRYGRETEEEGDVKNGQEERRGEERIGEEEEGDA